ncbi:NAD(P)-dependent alcohol dehydrogenase [Helicobacter felis]|uniref:NADP-dependent alcohol dehydrogenase n=1 Tax=Helicobacter felis (strain ATCC 49179 / CCUG 28539 / NCTC 12436 / CS1) TaxID=936155 RepID=E7ABX4_HELFC|nr:NAD(P)-dependent alcohol dehydrogenase [Helicobacter felis]CBY82943.1 NADP-dependent alcohol dehydrogenase [Helicobacter felis ATCC 49179]
MQRIPARGFAIHSKEGKFQPHEFTRHALGEKDVLIDIHYCGICHSDVHSAYSEWHEGTYPMIPGHEIAGVVKEVGAHARKFKVGDKVGVGCFVNSCRACEPCAHDHEQFCSKVVFTYDCPDHFHNNEPHMGGYSDCIVVDEDYTIRIPNDAPLEKIAPLFCAGITTYSPLKFSQVKAGSKVGIAGFGGLGHMGLKYALAMGAEVSVIGRSEAKREQALKMGAKHYYSDVKDAKGANLDLILSTIPTHYNMSAYLDALAYGGELSIVGLPPKDNPPTLSASTLVMRGNKKVYGSLIGGIKETQEMLDFSILHNIYPEIELVTGQDIDQVYYNLTHSNAQFRYVIDMKKSFGA